MSRLHIDNREIEVPQGSTILQAARKLGLDIPSLCFADGYEPRTSCMLCLVRVNGQSRLVPSCATPVEEGMRVESETEGIHEIRRAGLELLLSDHLGDCTAPCQHTCPTHMDIPLMLRQVAAGELLEAIVTVKRDIALPAVLGRVCPELCERTCRRSEVDQPLAICLIKRYVADVDLASDRPYVPPCARSTGKRVAIAGAGPTGLSAAFHLLQSGHACTLFDEHDEPGGVLRYELDEDQLPRSVLDAEIEIISRLGAAFQPEVMVGRARSLADLGSSFDAVLLTVGTFSDRDIKCLGVNTSGNRIMVDPKTYQTSTPGVFAAGDAVHPPTYVVRSVADGKSVAICIDQYLSGTAVTGPPKAFSIRAGRLSQDEIHNFAVGVSEADRAVPSGGIRGGLTDSEARAEATRCVNCDCSQRQGCKLRHYAQMYAATATRYRATRRAFERHVQHPDIVYEPGKCILCGLCIQVAEKFAEPLGLTFTGRGFDVRVGVPFNASIAEGLTTAGRQCAELCPTGALVLRSAVGISAASCGPCTMCPGDGSVPLRGIARWPMGRQGGANEGLERR